MESDLILSAQPAFPEPEDFVAEEPYLEAKLYIERVEQESNQCQEENYRDVTHEQLTTHNIEPLGPGVSNTVYPVRVPSMHFSCATVQWDMPQNPTDAASEDRDSSEVNSGYGLSMDWEVNPASLDIPLVNQEEIIDLVLDKDHEQTNDDLQQGPARSIEVESCQINDAHIEAKVCGTPSNKDDQTPFPETAQMSEATDDGVLMDCEKNSYEIESHPSTENPAIKALPEGLEVLEEEYVKPSDSEFLTEPEQGQGDVGAGNDGMELNSEDGINISVTPCEEDCSPSPQPETTDPAIELDSQQTEEPGHSIIQESDPAKPEVASDLVCDTVETVEAEDSQLVEFMIIANDAMLEVENTESFAETQECMVLEVKQEEPACEEQTESSLEVELHGHEEQLIEQSECLDESKQELTIGDEPSEEFKESSSEAESSEQANQTESIDEREASPSQEEPLEQSEISAEPDTTELSELKDSKETNKLQQTEQETHINTEQLQTNDTDGVTQTEDVSAKHMDMAEEQQKESVKPVVPHKNGNVEVVDREEAYKLAQRLYRLDSIQRTDVVRHLDKDNEFSRAVGEEYLKFYDFTDQTLDEALRSFLKEVVLIGETQERERVLDHFSKRYQQCNPARLSSSGAVLTLTCAVMLLNTDLHGQNVGKTMSQAVFISNLDGMNEGENFSKDLLKALYNSIKNHQLEWAVEEKELLTCITLDQDSDQDASLRSKSNPFQDLAHDKKATVFQKGFLKRKAHADIDGKRTPWGKRSWKTFYAVLKGMVLYLQKDEYKKDWQSSEEVLSVHHALAERAQDYTKRPHVFRLQTADWRVFLFEAQSTEQMNSWIGRINLVSALYSSPPFPAAVGSQRKFCRPILPATQSALTLEKQLQSHSAMVESFQEDLNVQRGAQETRRAKTRELEELRLKEEYLQHERSRYEAYVHILKVWQTLGKSSETLGGTDLTFFDQELWKNTDIEETEDGDRDGAMKRSHSSPSLELEVATPMVVKVKRNISERRTYRKIIIPRRNREV